MGMIICIVIPTRCIGDKKFVQNSSKELISPYLPEQIAGNHNF